MYNIHSADQLRKKKREKDANYDKKLLDKIKGKSDNKGEGVGVEDSEVFDFMPQTNVNIDTDRVKKNMLARNKYKVDKQKASIEYEEEQKKKRKEKQRDWQKRNLNKKE